MSQINQLKTKAIEEDILFIEINTGWILRWDNFKGKMNKSLHRAINEPCIIVLREFHLADKSFRNEIKDSLLAREWDGKPLHTHTRVYVEEEFGVVEYHSSDTIV